MARSQPQSVQHKNEILLRKNLVLSLRMELKSNQRQLNATCPDWTPHAWLDKCLNCGGKQSTHVKKCLELPKDVVQVIVEFVLPKWNATAFMFDSHLHPFWKSMAIARWPMMPSNARVKNWHKLFTARHIATTDPLNGFNVVIENCDWEFECPLNFMSLTTTNEQGVRYCSKCNQNVYLVTTAQQVVDHVQQGHCVAFTHEEEQPVDTHHEPKPAPARRRPMMGRRCF